jgi:hypothetical protein
VRVDRRVSSTHWRAAGVVDEGFGACVRGGAMRRPEGLGLARKVITVEEGKVSGVGRRRREASRFDRSSHGLR